MTAILLMRAVRFSEPDRLSDQDDVDAAGQLLVDLENLSDVAVLPVGGIRASVLKLEAVLEDPIACRVKGWDEFLRADDEDDVRGAPCVGGKLAAGRRGDHETSLTGERVDTPA